MVSAVGVAVLASTAALAGAAGCTQQGDAAVPTGPEAGPLESLEAGDEDGGDAGVVYTLCPDAIDASFGSIQESLLSTIAGCINICHTPSGAFANGDLDFQLDASAIYAELLGPDGGGEPASNKMGSAHILRVEPFDPDASLLYIKLNLHSMNNALYGSGMPQNAPGTVCPPAVDAVRAWIAGGAEFGVDGGALGDGAGD